MIRLVRFIFLISLFSTSLFAQTDPLKGFDAYAEEAMKAWGVPGLAIAIVKDDKVIYALAFGVLENGKQKV